MVVHLAGLGYAVHLLTPETVADTPDALPIDPAAALSVLAVAQQDNGLALARLTRAALGLLSGGGLLVAVLAAHDESALRSVATLRRPGATAVAMVLDTGSFASGSRGVPSGLDAARAVDLLRGSGWRATTVARGDSVDRAWGEVGSRADTRVGSGASR
jgi:hypothetical protein